MTRSVLPKYVLTVTITRPEGVEELVVQPRFHRDRIALHASPHPDEVGASAEVLARIVEGALQGCCTPVLDGCMLYEVAA